MTLILDSVLRVPKKDVPDWLYPEFVVHPKYGGEPFKEYQVDDDWVYFPRQARNMFSGFKIDDRRVEGRKIEFPPSNYREKYTGQTSTIIQSMECLLHSPCGGGVLVAGCGKGKTIMGTELAIRLGRPTCIMVHKEYLGEQWEEAIKMLAPGASVGWVKQDRCDMGFDHDFVIASTQSIVSPTRVYERKFYASFGLLLLDEVHRYGAEVWQQVMWKFPTKYRLGLTATAGRFDGMWSVITDNIGPIAAELESDPIDFQVFTVNVGTEIDSSSYDKPWLDKKMKLGKLTSLLANHEGRNKVITRNLIKAYKANRKVLVLSSRRKQLDTLAAMMKREGVLKQDIGFFVGGVKGDARVEVSKKQMILATYQMAEEGLDIVELDALFPVTPRAHVIQTTGRILREFEGKKLPSIVDLVDYKVKDVVGFAYSRRREYESMGATIEGTIKQED